MKRLLLITTSYPEQTEGAAAAGVFVRDFAHELASTGIAVEVLAPAAKAGTTRETGITVTRFATPRLPLSLLRPGRPQDWPAITVTLARGRQAVLEACDRCRPDHVLALWALPSGAWAMHAGKRHGIGYSTWALGSDIWSLGKIPVLRQYLGHVMRQARYRFADGLQLARDVEDICQRPCAFLASSRNFGPAPVRMVSAAPPYRLAFLGRWHENKGVDLLLAALELLSDRDWLSIAGVRLHGGGALEAQVLARALALQHAGRPVEVGGYLDLEGARALFAWTDYVMLPSRIESIPVVFSDAMQARRPLIATPVGDLPKLIQEYGCGLLASGTDADSIAQTIRQGLQSDAARYSEGTIRAGRQFDIRASARDFLQAIEPHV